MTRQLPLGLAAPPPSLAGEDFLVAPSNLEATTWIDLWPDWPAPVLVLVGPAGAGKTHLAHLWQRRSGARRVEATGLTDEMVGEVVREGGAVLVEDADRGARETAFLHLVNLVGERGGHLLVTARTPPARWELTLPDLRSRLTAASVVSLGPPEDELLGAVLVKLFRDRQLRVGADVVTYLLPRIERSFEAARRIVRAVDEAAFAEGRGVTVPLVRRVLEEGHGTPG